MHIDLVTALPELVRSPLDGSIVGRARERGLVEIDVHDLREWAEGKHRQVDDLPYGGGGGMVLKPEPVFAAIEDLASRRRYDEVIFLTPDGVRLDQPLVNRLSLADNLLLFAGHYKNVDERARESLFTIEVSIGDYVLTGGELPALVLVDAIVRLLPGVISDAGSAMSDSFQDGLLDAPAYTRPPDYRGLRVPDVLLSGDHAAVDAWREAQRVERTRRRRPDLLAPDDREES